MNNSTTSSTSRQLQPTPGAIPGAYTLGELLKNREVLEPPTPIAARFAWPGRITLLAGREKLGKSTLARSIASAVSSERSFLGEETQAGPVLYFALEEHIEDVARNLEEHGADHDKTIVITRLGEQPKRRLKTAVEAYQPSLVAVDTLAAFASPLDLDPGSSSDWTPILSFFREVAEDVGCGILILHHARKSDGQYRDSSAIGAGVDVILTMTPGGGSHRDIQVKGRLSNRDFTVRYADSDQSEDSPRFELVGGQPPLEERVLECVRDKPGCSTREVRDSVRGKYDRCRAVLEKLKTDGRIENKGNDGRHQWMIASTEPCELEPRPDSSPQADDSSGVSHREGQEIDAMSPLRGPGQPFPVGNSRENGREPRSGPRTPGPNGGSA